MTLCPTMNIPCNQLNLRKKCVSPTQGESSGVASPAAAERESTQSGARPFDSFFRPCEADILTELTGVGKQLEDEAGSYQRLGD